VAEIHVFLAWLEARGLDLHEVRTEDLMAYQADLYAARKKDGKPYAASSHHGRLIALKSLFRFLQRRGYVLTDPASSVPLPRREKRIPRTILSQEEARRILDAVTGRSPRELRDRAILETFYATGIRAGELASLKVEDVDTEERVLRVVLGKGGKDRNVPLTTAAAEAIDAYLARGRRSLVGPAGSRFLFLGLQGTKLDRARLNRIVHEWARTVGVKKNVTCHTFRHSVATHLLKGDADIRHIQALLGHASLSTTERYTRVEISDLRAVLRRAHPRGR
jgi:integrase/recombinase XerD